MQNFYCSSRVEKCGGSQQGEERHQNAHPPSPDPSPRTKSTHCIENYTPNGCAIVPALNSILYLSGKKLKNAALLSLDWPGIRMRTKSRSVTENKQTNTKAFLYIGTIIFTGTVLLNMRKAFCFRQILFVCLFVIPPSPSSGLKMSKYAG